MILFHLEFDSPVPTTPTLSDVFGLFDEYTAFKTKVDNASLHGSGPYEGHWGVVKARRGIVLAAELEAAQIRYESAFKLYRERVESAGELGRDSVE